MGHLLLGVDTLQDVEDLSHDQGGEAEARLVAQQKPRPTHKRPGDGEHLLFAT